MTRPSQIYFGPDGGPWRNGVAAPKVYLRALLFGTSKRGRIIESMHVSVTRDEARQTFPVWVYGQRGELARGSGLFVGETGVEASHHFLPVRDTSTFQFREGSYRLDVFAQVLGSRLQKLMFSHVLEVTPEVARQLQELDAGIYFDWAPESSRYMVHVDKRPPQPDAAEFLELLGTLQRERGNHS